MCAIELRIEQGHRLAALAVAVADVMQQRVDARVGHVGVAAQVPAGVEQPGGAHQRAQMPPMQAAHPGDTRQSRLGRQQPDAQPAGDDTRVPRERARHHMLTTTRALTATW